MGARRKEVLQGVTRYDLFTARERKSQLGGHGRREQQMGPRRSSADGKPRCCCVMRSDGTQPIVVMPIISSSVITALGTTFCSWSNTPKHRPQIGPSSLGLSRRALRSSLRSRVRALIDPGDKAPYRRTISGLHDTRDTQDEQTTS